MRKLNPIEKSRYIRENYKKYLKYSFHFGNDELQKKFEEQIEQEDLFKGPYIDLNLPFQRGKSLNELMAEGVISKSFRKLGGLNFSRPLYAHQEEAIRMIGEGRSAVITTGTGSGKTESFLYPILNDILKSIDKGNKKAGIRAVFLYPMNALVNDQIERIRSILSGYPDITYGSYTGDTPETVPGNYRKKQKADHGITVPENELVSREEIRERAPHLLFTNYSMLEYILLRPNDCQLFAPGTLDNWNFVVLDEAHSYYGSKGIEIALLMRRLTGLAPKKPQFILTSATLGEKGKSEKEIVEFAKNLTSAEFGEKDIIFSKRIPLILPETNYVVSDSDYIELKNNIKNVDKVKSICQKYVNTENCDIAGMLYNLLSADLNVHKLYAVLAESSKSFNNVLDKFNGAVTDIGLISMIDLINAAEKNNIGLYELKYHSFVRPLAGAYITYENPPQLSLTKTNYIGNMKAFEVGNCRFCSVPYIIGKIRHNESNGIDYLFQNNEIDIYENYGSNENAKLDYFLLEDAVAGGDTDMDKLEEFMLCASCGCAYPADRKGTKKCECDNKFLVKAYRVKSEKKTNDDPFVYNNVNNCPCCGHSGRSGVVKSLNIGKDEGTALIAQMLYEAIDDNITAMPKPKKFKLGAGGFKPVQVHEEPKTKQFLTFSDSRQQASFFATFLNRNHVKLLQKRIIWEVLQKNDHNAIDFETLISKLDAIIDKESLFKNNMSSRKNAWLAALTELMSIDGAYDGENLGLFYFDLDLDKLLEDVSDEDVEGVFPGCGLNKADLNTLIQVVLRVFKVVPALQYVESNLTPEEKDDNLGYRKFDNSIEFKLQKSENNIRSFLPIKKDQENSAIRYVKKVCSCDNAMAEKILDTIFNEIGINFFEPGRKNKGYQIDTKQYVLKSYKTAKYYQCSKCGRLTPRNIHNLCPHDKCDGILKEANPDEVMANNFYRMQYMNKKIEAMVVEEHTAQLKKDTAKQFQEDFKNKNINILSCSTTFEMGIDIGDLETVFMRNVPPFPANYVQRAGRAGRRKDSSAYVLTFCSTSSHDYTYFLQPENMISGVINPPHFNVSNRKIILRHLMATSLGFFFKNNPEYFHKIEDLVLGDGVLRFKEYLLSKPQDLCDYIDHKILPERDYEDYHNYKWLDIMNGNMEKMDFMVESIRQLIADYEEVVKKALAEQDYRTADNFNNIIKRIKNENVISNLSSFCVIPKYGFPVDVVELKIYENGVPNQKYEMSRDLKVAISEYAPDSEVIVDKTKYASKYITLPKTSGFARNYYIVCPKCGKINISITKDIEKECKYCGESLKETIVDYFIEPIYGFKTGPTQETTRLKPKRSYSGNVLYLGGGIKDENIVNIKNALIIETSTEDELLIMNRSKFYMCNVCGYSDIEKGRRPLPIKYKEHKNFKQSDCSCNSLELLDLGHRFRTDVARFTIPILSTAVEHSYSKALSFLYAFLEGVSRALEIERNDIDGIIEMHEGMACYDILLYDNVPGGAGHVKRLTKTAGVIDSLRAALVKVSLDCCDENTSCYNCLRNYYNQNYHSRIKRGYAKAVIEELLKSVTSPDRLN